MPRTKKTARRPLKRERFAGMTVTVQRSKRQGYAATVVLRQGGKRLREKSCRTKEEAEGVAEKWAIEAGNTGASAAAAISDGDKRFMMQAKEQLAVYGKAFPDALAFYLEHLKSAHSSKPVLEVVDALLSHREKKGKSKRYQLDLKNRLERFAENFKDRMIADISSEEVERWLESLSLAPVTTNNFRRLLHVLWAFAISKQWVRENVVSSIEPQTVRGGRPGILTIEQARALLNKADDAILPYYALALFGGLRDEELRRLDWRDVSFPTEYVRISANVSKTGRERLVPITANMKEWLQPIAKARGRVTPPNARKWLKKARKDAEIAEWPHDATRHSFGTYEMARTKDIGHVSEVMGNSPAVVQKHYKAAIPFEQGNEYFGIMPNQQTNIIPITNADAGGNMRKAKG